MWKLSFKFYFLNIGIGIAFFLTIGGVLGWFASESGMLSIFVGVLGFFCLSAVAYFVLKTILQQPLEKIEVFQFLLPNLISFLVIIPCFCLNLFKESLQIEVLYQIVDSDMLKWFLAFLLPCASYPVIAFWGTLDFTFQSYYMVALLFSLLYCLELLVFLFAVSKQIQKGQNWKASHIVVSSEQNIQLYGTSTSPYRQIERKPDKEEENTGDGTRKTGKTEGKTEDGSVS